MPVTDSLPPPISIDSEREVLSELLNGFIRTEQMPWLRAEHFTELLPCEVYRLLTGCKEAPQLAGIAEALRERGYRGDLLAWLEGVAYSLPSYGRAHCLEAARAVLELARRRSLEEKIERVAIGLRCGSMTSSEAIECLRYLVTSKPRKEAGCG